MTLHKGYPLKELALAGLHRACSHVYETFLIISGTMVSSQCLKIMDSISKESKIKLEKLRNGTLNEWNMTPTEAICLLHSMSQKWS